MTYVDVTLTPEATYTYVHNKQLYDVIAGALTTHTAWDFVESVDAVTGGVTYRRYVWKCNSAQSGLTADFFVVFQVAFTTATGVYFTGTGAGAQQYIRVWMGENYSAGVLSKFATNNTSVTTASDLTNPATFTLATYAVPTTIVEYTNYIGQTTDATSLRFFVMVAKDAIILPRSGNASTTTTSYMLLYVGAYERLLSAAVDPAPLIIMGCGFNTAPGYPGGGATRAVTMTASTAYTDAFGVRTTNTAANNQQIGDNTGYELNPSLMIGVLGTPATTTWFKNFGGPVVSRLMIYPACAQVTHSQRPVRGYLKYVYGANLATHAMGDTFVVDGKVYVGTGQGNTFYAVVNTEAV